MDRKKAEANYGKARGNCGQRLDKGGAQCGPKHHSTQRHYRAVPYPITQLSGERGYHNADEIRKVGQGDQLGRSSERWRSKVEGKVVE